MLKWLFGRKKEEPKSETKIAAVQAVQPAAAPAPQPSPAAATAPVERAPAPTVAPEPAPASVVQAAPAAAQSSTQAPKAVLLKQSLSLLAEGSDMEPKVGLDALAVAPPLIESAKVVKVQAGGRRVVASFGNSAKVRVYSKRADGTYWLEGAPAQSSSRLIVGATA